MLECALPLTTRVARRLCGRPLLVLLDVDGTLSPIAPRPEYAIVPPETQRVVLELTALAHTVVAAISGRSATDARRMLGSNVTWVIGNHGIELAAPNEPPTARGDVERFAGALAAARDRCEALAARDSGVIVEDKRWTLSIHYRLAHPQIVPALVADVSAVARELGLRMTQGKEVIELRPPIPINKGTAAVELANRVGALGSSGSILCAGDDRTDEDAFVALRTAQPISVTVRVGVNARSTDSAAEFYVSDPDEMRMLLESVLALRGGSAG